MEESQAGLKRRITRRAALKALGLAGLAGVAAACTPAPAPSPTAPLQKPAATSAPPAPPQPGATAAPAVKVAPSAPSQQQLLIATSERFAETLEPLNQTTLSIMQVERHVLEPLLEREVAGKLVPVLAESWTMLSDTTWQFNLRKGVKFHNGEEFNAESVKYTLERVGAADSKMKKHTYWGTRLKGVEIKDPYTVLVHTNEPFGTLLAVLTITDMEPPKLAQADPQYWNKTLVGTGPFKWTEYKKDQELTFMANTEYWGGAPKIGKVVWRLIPETSTRLAAFKSGEVSIIDAVPPEEIEVINKMADAQVLSATTYQQVGIGFNCEKSPLDKKEVRQALNYAIDKEAIVKDFLGGNASLPVAPVAGTVFGAVKQTPYSYDPAKAKQLLSQAGASGMSLTIDEQSQYPKSFEISQFIASQLQAIGVNCKVNKTDIATWQDRRIKGTFEASYIGCANVTGDADLCLALLFFSKLNPTTPNRARYNNPKADEYITKGASSLKESDRLAAYAEACKIIWEDSPHISLYDAQAKWAVRKNVQGFEARPDTFTIVRKASVG